MSPPSPGVSDSDSDDVEDMDIEVTAEQLESLQSLQSRLEQNGRDYDAHVQYVTLLRACRLREKLREARVAFHEAYPLTEALWLEWIEDESEALETMEDVERLEALLGESHGDYLSVSLWKEHIDVSKARFEQRKAKGEEEGVAAGAMREVLDAALRDCGMHVVEGAGLWNACLDFELDVVGAGARDEGRIEGLFARFLACPFPPAVLEGARARYVAWRRDGDGDGEDGDKEEENQEVPRALEKSIERAGRAYELRRGHEEALVASRAAEPGGMNLLSTYASYVELEVASGAGSEARARAVFERAIVEFPTSDFLWKSYLAWADARGKSVGEGEGEGEGEVGTFDAASRGVLLRRALRNCPWSGDVWMRLVGMPDAADTAGTADEADATDVLAQCRPYLETNAMEFQKVVIAWVRASSDASRNEELLRACMGILKEQNVVDPDHRCAWLLSSMLADGHGQGGGGRGGGPAQNDNDVEAGAAVWEGLVAEGTLDAQYHGTWTSYYEYLVRFGGDAAAKRSVFERAMVTVGSAADRAYVGRAWVMFEEREGSREDLEVALCRSSDVLRQAEAAQRGIALELDQVTKSLADADAKLRRQQRDPNFNKRGGSGRGGAKPKGKQQKKKKANGDKVDKVNDKGNDKGNDRGNDRGSNKGNDKGNEGNEGNEDGPPAGRKRKAAGSAKDERGEDKHEKNNNDHNDESTTVFIKYLDASVTEAELAAEFALCGTDLDISLGRDPKTKCSKGFAFIKCSKETSDNLCALNGKEHKGKKLLITPADKNHKKKGAGAADKRKPGRRPKASLPKEHQRARMAIGGTSATALVPRGAVKRQEGTEKEAEGTEKGTVAPKSNDEFRKMFM